MASESRSDSRRWSKYQNKQRHAHKIPRRTNVIPISISLFWKEIHSHSTLLLSPFVPFAPRFSFPSTYKLTSHPFHTRTFSEI
ncbi:hypothetical protein RJT34_04779 [Clitoria ternatea]|uniref:Uncharacterized protein n=1 Tax=Clitoria ternatea TaxID=43366 RepID=A0AAN9KQC7_CLITE